MAFFGFFRTVAKILWGEQKETEKTVSAKL
jgi:hypothetical protein